MAAEYGEPWRLGRNPRLVVAADGAGVIDHETGREDMARRAVACVNAMEGEEMPAAVVERGRRLDRVVREAVVLLEGGRVEAALRALRDAVG